jgi:hypothetical protein
MERDLSQLIEDLASVKEASVLPYDALRERTSQVRALRRMVEERWGELPQNIREALYGLTRSWDRGLLQGDPALLEEGNATEGPVGEFLREARLLFRVVADRLEESDPAFWEALRKALAEEGVSLEKEELSRSILEP